MQIWINLPNQPRMQGYTGDNLKQNEIKESLYQAKPIQQERKVLPN